jgi:hypothetical protein
MSHSAATTKAPSMPPAPNSLTMTATRAPSRFDRMWLTLHPHAAALSCATPLSFFAYSRRIIIYGIMTSDCTQSTWLKLLKQQMTDRPKLSLVQTPLVTAA